MDLKRKGWLSAGYTVEASAVVPLLLALILFCILWAFSLHDAVVLQAKVIGAAYGMEFSEESLFLLEDGALEVKEGLWSTAYKGSATYPGLSVPLLDLFGRPGTVTAQWMSEKAAFPAFLRLQQLYGGVTKQEE